jgi:hypothetical protein
MLPTRHLHTVDYILDCGSPPSISNGVVTLDDASLTEFGATASVNCSANYAADKLSISCQANGKWDKATCTLNGMSKHLFGRSFFKVAHCNFIDRISENTEFSYQK